jgi:zinc-ribbon domain
MTIGAFCPDCGAEITGESRSCPACGRDMLAIGSRGPAARLSGDPRPGMPAGGPPVLVKVAGWLWLVVAGLQTIVTGSSVLETGFHQATDWIGLAFAFALIALALAVGRGLAFRPTRSVGASALLLGALWLALGVLSVVLGVPAGAAIAVLAVLAAVLSFPAVRSPRPADRA